MATSLKSAPAPAFDIASFWQSCQEDADGAARAADRYKGALAKSGAKVREKVPALLAFLALDPRGLTPGKVAGTIVERIRPESADDKSADHARRSLRRALNTLRAEDENGTTFGMVKDARGGSNATSPSEMLADALKALADAPMPVAEKRRIVVAALNASGFNVDMLFGKVAV